MLVEVCVFVSHSVGLSFFGFVCLVFFFHSDRQKYERVSGNTQRLLKLLFRTGSVPSSHVSLVTASHMAKPTVSEMTKHDKGGSGGQTCKNSVIHYSISQKMNPLSPRLGLQQKCLSVLLEHKT